MLSPDTGPNAAAALDGARNYNEPLLAYFLNFMT